MSQIFVRSYGIIRDENRTLVLKVRLSPADNFRDDRYVFNFYGTDLLFCARAVGISACFIKSGKRRMVAYQR